MRLSIIAAVSRNGIIGNDYEIPWPKISEDLKRFREITTGKCVIMGRKTFLSFPVRNPDDRTFIIISRNKEFIKENSEKYPHMIFVDSITKALDKSLRESEDRESDEIIVAGGGEIYSQFINDVDRLYLTEVKMTVMGNISFPKIETEMWNLVSFENIDYDNGVRVRYTMFDRKTNEVRNWRIENGK